MKKIKLMLIIVLIIFMTSALCVNIYAEGTETATENEDSEITVDADTVSRINSCLSGEEIALLKNTEIDGIVIDEQYNSKYPVLSIFHSPFYFPQAGEPLSKLLPVAQDCKKGEKAREYIVLDTEMPYCIRFLRDNGETKVYVRDCYSSLLPTYVSDIMILLQNISSKEYQLEGIYCFDGETSHLGTVVYYKTDKGVYVKYYENSLSKAVQFTEEEFTEKAAAYYEYLTSYEHNYDENGMGLNGLGMTFLTFIQQAPLEGGSLETDDQSVLDNNALSNGCAASVTATSLHTMLFVVLICVTAGIRIKSKKSVE